LNEIARLNAEQPTATFAVNQFADLTEEERMALLTWKPSPGKKNYVYTLSSPTKKDVNWVEAGETTKVKDQGSCGSCWAFSGTETVESAYALAHGLSGDQVPQLAEQQAVDCAKYPEYGSMGCNGGWMDDVFDYYMTHKACTEAEYKYTARDGTCKEDQCSLDLGLTGRVNIPEGDLDALLTAAETVPIAIAVDASSWSFYSGGILKSKKTNLNHGVQLDGYHIDSDDQEYLFVRNSWGSRWGESGYIRLDKE
jgi:C1A family cysteine protease